MIKNIISCIVAVCSMFFIAGCNDEMPSLEKMTTVSTVVGKTAGYACELSKTKTEVKEGIMKVLDIATKVTPSTNETFTVAWAPVISEELSKLNLKDSELSIAKIALTAATEGLDFVFAKYPKAKSTQETISSLVAGFISGYKSVVTMSSTSNVEINEEALKVIKAKIAK